MKTLFKGFLIASLMFIGVAANAQTRIYSNVGTIDVTKAEYNGDQVDLAYTITIDPDVQNIIGLKGKKGIVLTTALAEGDFKQVIECLVISPAKGNARSAWLEDRVEDVTNNVRYFNAKADEPLVIKSNYTLKAKDWTSPDTRLTITTQELKKAECLVRLNGPKQVAKLKATDIVPQWSNLNPGDGTAEKHLSTKLYYPVNVTKEVVARAHAVGQLLPVRTHFGIYVALCQHAVLHAATIGWTRRWIPHVGRWIGHDGIGGNLCRAHRQNEGTDMDSYRSAAH